jgi:hypothetical protein
MIFVICAAVLLMLLDHSLLWIGLLAATHWTLNFDRALRRELYPHLSVGFDRR